MDISKFLKKKDNNTYEVMYGQEKAKILKDKLSKSHKGHKAPITAFKKGQIPWNKGLTKDSDERIKEYSKYNKGEKHYKWKGGSCTSYHIESRKLLGVIDKNLVVHHIDGNYKNNSLDNLRIMTIQEHGHLHNSNKHLSPATEFKKGNIPWNKKIFKIMKGGENGNA